MTLVSRVGLGGLFIFTGVAKLGTLGEFATLAADYHVLPSSLARAYGYVLPPLEVAIGILLIAGLFLRASAILSILVTLSFLIAKSIALYRGEDFNCGCFGTYAETLTSVTIALDIVMLALGFQILLHRGEFLSLEGRLSRRGAKP